MTHRPRTLALALGALGLALAAGGRALAEESAADAEESAEAGSEQPDVDDTVTGGRPRVTVAGSVRLDDEGEWHRKLAAYEGREYPAIFYLGGQWLDLEPSFIAACHEGLDRIYKRDYKGALAHFNGLAERYKGMGIGPVGQVLVWQALMLENFDFKYEQQYQHASRRARQELEEAMQLSGNEAWEYFLMGGMLGIESIHTMRHEEYSKALTRGYEAMKAVKKCQELAPDFVDMQLGDGLFNYWSSVVSQATKFIPDLPDKRAEGIKQLTVVERRSLFLRPPATLALTFTWIEEGKKKNALRSALNNHKDYPDNVINNLVLGRVYMYNRMYTQSEQTYQHVLKTAPDNQRAHYYLGRLYLRWNKVPEARASFERYLAFNDLSDQHRAYALYYLGNTYYRKKDWDKAEEYYKEAWKVAKLKRAKSRMDRIKEKRKG